MCAAPIHDMMTMTARLGVVLGAALTLAVPAPAQAPSLAMLDTL